MIGQVQNGFPVVFRAGRYQAAASGCSGLLILFDVVGLPAKHLLRLQMQAWLGIARTCAEVVARVGEMLRAQQVAKAEAALRLLIRHCQQAELPVDHLVELLRQTGV